MNEVFWRPKAAATAASQKHLHTAVEWKGRRFRTHMTVPGFRHAFLLRQSVSVAYVLLFAIDTELE